MKKTLLLAFVLFFPFFAQAQEEKDDVTLIQTIYGKDKRALMTEYLQIPEAQAPAFWSTYESYESDRKEIGKKRWALLNEYATNYENLDDAKAEKLANELLDNNLATDKLNKKYYKKFAKASSGLKAAQFLQMELYLQNSIRQEISEDIPFIGEIEKTRKDL